MTPCPRPTRRTLLTKMTPMTRRGRACGQFHELFAARSNLWKVEQKDLAMPSCRNATRQSEFIFVQQVATECGVLGTKKYLKVESRRCCRVFHVWNSEVRSRAVHLDACCSLFSCGAESSLLFDEQRLALLHCFSGMVSSLKVQMEKKLDHDVFFSMLYRAQGTTSWSSQSAHSRHCED